MDIRKEKKTIESEELGGSKGSKEKKTSGSRTLIKQ